MMNIRNLLLVIHLMAIPRILQVGPKNLHPDFHHILHMKMNIHLLDGLNLPLVILTTLLVGLRTIHTRTNRTRIWTMSTTTTITDTHLTTTTIILPSLPTPLNVHQRSVRKSATSLLTQTAPAFTQPPSLKMEEATVMWGPSNLTYRYGVTWTLTPVILMKLAQMPRKAVQRKGIIGPDLPALL